MTRWLHVLRMRLRTLLRGAHVDRDLARELRTHLDAAIDEKVAAGGEPGEARRLALREFGSVGSVSEACRDTRRVSTVQNLARDLRHGARGLIREPMLAGAAIASIALGVGANLTIFALGSQLLLSVPTAAEPDRLVFIRTGTGSHVSLPAWERLDGRRVLAGVAGYRLEAGVNWRGPVETISISPLVVTPNFFDVVGVPVARGRGFTADEAALDGDPHIAVVSHGFWQQRLGADPDVLGRALTFNGEPYTVSGVLPADLTSLPGYGLTPDVYLSANRALMPQRLDAEAPAVMLIGRRHTDQSVDQARAAVATVLPSLAAELDDEELARLADLAPLGSIAQLQDFEVLAAFMVVLMLVAGFVLAIACANVAGLLLARGTTRRREVALRVALGASRWRLAQQCLAEGLVLAFAGGAAGGALTATIGALLPAVALPIPVPLSLGLAYDVRLAVLAAGLVMLTTLLCALMPALRTSRAALVPALKITDAVRGGHQRSRRVLVVAQVAVSVLLLVTALLFLRNLARASSLDPGFDVDPVLVAEVTFVEGRQGSGAPAIAALAGALRAVPGVRSAAVSDGVPLTLAFGATVGTEAVFDPETGPRRIDYVGNIVGPGYFDTLGIPVVAGRAFTSADGPGAPLAAVVNQEFARRYFDGRSPVGHRFAEQGSRDQGALTIVGVVGDSRYRTIGEGPTPAVYRAYLQQPAVPRLGHLLIRAAAPGSVTPGRVRDALRRADPTTAIAIEPMASALAFAFLPSRIGASLVGALAAVGTLLAMIGLYGVIAYMVQRRTAEIGIRVALGASRARILRLVLRDGGRLVGLGAAAGLGGALLITQPLAAFLVAGLSPSDPVSFGGTLALLLLVSAAALWGPARRALRVQPTEALRAE